MIFLLADPIITFLNVFRTSIENLALYPPGNPAVEKQFNNFRVACREMTQPTGELELEYRDALLYVNGQIQTERVLGHPLVRWLRKVLHDRQISKLTMEPGPTIKEIQAISRIFNLSPQHFNDSVYGQTLLDNAAVSRIRFNDFPAASQDAAIPTHQTAETDFFSPIKTTPARIEMSPQEEYTLKHNILELIRNGKLDRVAESLVLICHDLYGSDRRLREMGVASYRVVVHTMIQENLDKPLSQVQKGMVRDLDQIEESDIFSYHLETLHEIMVFFKNAIFLKPMIDGMAWLASRSHRYEKTKRDAIRGFFLQFLDDPIVDMLIRNIETNSAFKSPIEKLFMHHGSSFVQPLLQVLYKTESRPLRHAIMRQLQRMGPVIHGDLLEELKRNIAVNGPWFVKRNLLQLLSEKPPANMVDMLEELIAEGQPKLFELINRCLFRIQHQDAYQLGKQQLARSPDSEKIKLIALVGSSKIKAYAPLLIDIIEGPGPEELKITAIKALGRLDTNEGIQSMAKILTNKSLFSGKARETLREAAAQSLSVCSLPQAQEALSAVINDRNKMIRDIANRKCLAGK